MSMRKRLTLFAAAIAAFAAVRALADLSGSYVVPLDDPAIQYATGPVSDPVSKLKERVERGEVKLDFDPRFGYLPSVLRHLNVPLSSQMLVFSKTSLQSSRIFPRTPRAIYFNDQVAVGWVRHGDVLEIASIDPRQGAIFYALDQVRSQTPDLARRDDCLQCHYNGGTVGVPGLLVRSIYPDLSGQPLFHLGQFISDHRSPLKERWGGWYVSGTHGKQTHLGNMTYERGSWRDNGIAVDNLASLSRHIDTDAYLRPHSDIVALMVLEHQTRMQNLITRVGYETRMAIAAQTAVNELLKEPSDQLRESTRQRINGAADELAAYMLFAGETRLESRIAGTSGFAEEFARQGPKDRRGRSLRQFELTRRIFQYPCSYLIYSKAFDALPEPAKARIYQRLWDVLSGQDTSAKFAHLSPEDRRAIREILLETKPGLPDYWR
jgi:hypothetical protein